MGKLCDKRARGVSEGEWGVAREDRQDELGCEWRKQKGRGKKWNTLNWGGEKSGDAWRLAIDCALSCKLILSLHLCQARELVFCRRTTIIVEADRSCNELSGAPVESMYQITEFFSKQP